MLLARCHPTGGTVLSMRLFRQPATLRQGLPRFLPTAAPLPSSAAVRTKAMEVLGKCHAQLGPSLVDFLEGLKPAQLMALEEHFRQNPLTQVRRQHGGS